MKTMERKEPPEHGEEGHFCDEGCAAYAKGGKVAASVDHIEKNPKPEMPIEHGTAGLEGLTGYAEGGQVEAAEEADAKDPSELPEDIREFIDKMHKEKRESRPDEGWRISAMQKNDDIAPYVRDEEDPAADPDIMGQLKGLTGYAEGGQVDPEGDLGLLQPPGAGIIAPSIATPPPAPASPPISAPVPAPAAITPKPVTPATPALTDDDFMNKANKMLGLQPEEQAGFMKLLGANAQKGQLGAGLAGIGDAIASGGTLGKVNPGALNKSEEIIQGKTKEGLEGLQTIRGNQEKASEMADKLESRDPNSPLSKYAQKAYAGVGKKIGLDLSHASAALIADVSGKGVEALNTEYQGQLKQMGLQLQKSQLDATIANQRSEREIQKATNIQGAAKALADKGAIKSLVDMIPGTAGHAANKVLERQANAGTDPEPVSVNTRAQYDALPSGTHYVDSFGTQKVKK